MTTPIRNAKDFWAGLIYLTIGLAAVFIARGYDMGSATRMGPAYFPTVLGGLLALIGTVAVARSFFSQGKPIGVFAYRAALLVCGGVVLFSVLLRGAGVVIAIIVLVLASSYASIRFRWSWAVLLALGLAVFCLLVFVKGLGVPLPLLGSWFEG